MVKLNLIFLIAVVLGCQQKDQARIYAQAQSFDFPYTVDTSDKQIFEQQKRSYDFDGVRFDNEFEAARYNLIERKNDSVFVVTINPENEPINMSPWYAFRLSTNELRKIYIELNYDQYKHRYDPKSSLDRLSWSEIDISSAFYNSDSTSFTFPIEIDESPRFISAQEIFNSTDLSNWVSTLAASPLVNHEMYGKSQKNRDLQMLDIYKDSKEGKKLIIILSRQHPPEVTGFFAMQAFVQAILDSEDNSDFLNDYRLLVYPMLNPDGVDMGHWRHNANGVDLNRDWAYYNQPEIKQVADHVVKEAFENNSNVILGLDFHSTYHDIYYTQDKEKMRTITTDWFRDQWFEKIEDAIPGYKVNERPSGLGKPVSKSWFYTQFHAEAMTYEIGDKTPRDSIQLIGRIAGEEMMKVLLANKDKF